VNNHLPFDFLFLLRREDQVGTVGITLREQVEQIDGLLGIRLLHLRQERLSSCHEFSKLSDDSGQCDVITSIIYCASYARASVPIILSSLPERLSKVPRAKFHISRIDLYIRMTECNEANCNSNSTSVVTQHNLRGVTVNSVRLHFRHFILILPFLLQRMTIQYSPSYDTDVHIRFID